MGGVVSAEELKLGCEPETGGRAGRGPCWAVLDETEPFRASDTDPGGEA